MVRSAARTPRQGAALQLQWNVREPHLGLSKGTRLESQHDRVRLLLLIRMWTNNDGCDWQPTLGSFEELNIRHDQSALRAKFNLLLTPRCPCSDFVFSDARAYYSIFLLFFKCIIFGVERV